MRAVRRILREYVTVARRPRFARAGETLIRLIQVVSVNAAFVAPETAAASLPDPKDQAYLDAALAGGADAIITGNKKHFPDAACRDVRTISVPPKLR